MTTDRDTVGDALACAERLENYDTCHDGDVDEAARLLRSLAAIVELLPVTADGVRVAPGMTISCIISGRILALTADWVNTQRLVYAGHAWWRTCEMFSTRGAALAAREGAQ